MATLWTDEQRAVIDSTVGHQAVFAAPGSGKTTVLTHHIANCVTRDGIPPGAMMAVTFTKQAAAHMRRRMHQLASLTHRQAESLRIGTFHAQVFEWVLRHLPDLPIILRQTEQLQFIRAALRKAGVGGGMRPETVLHVLSRIKASWPHANPPHVVQKVVQHYEALKRRHRRWDFDDVLAYWCLLHDNGQLRFLPQLQYVLVDEFQDTNHIQWYILTCLVKRLGCKVFVVGDDDQAIYGFRGTDPSWLKAFPNRLPGVKVHYLSTNFRSDRSIVHGAERLILHNYNRTQKSILPYSRQDGLSAVLVHKDRNHEFHWIRARVRCLSGSDAKRTVGILARTRRQLTDLYQHLCRELRTVPPFVEFRTFHSAKGLEWDEVHLLDAVEDNPFLVPTDRSLFEEERRLFYVAMTRARHTLFVHWPQQMNRVRMAPSRFIHEAGMEQLYTDSIDPRIDPSRNPMVY